jgi:hypothetical protein
MPLPLYFARIPEAVGRFIANISTWSPLERRVKVTVEISDDPLVAGNQASPSGAGDISLPNQDKHE